MKPGRARDEARMSEPAWKAFSPVNLRGLMVYHDGRWYHIETHIRNGYWRVRPIRWSWSKPRLVLPLRFHESGGIEVIPASEVAR